jgi:hypothetical protein
LLADAGDLDADGDDLELTPLDLAGNPRVMDDPSTADGGCGHPAVVDMGAFEFAGDAGGASLHFADFDRDGEIGFGDLLVMLSAWGDDTDCRLDLYMSGDFTFADLVVLLANWS